MINLSSIDYNEIINQEKIVSYFQELYSVNRKNIIGIEALSRGINSKGDIISPISLIKYARENNSSIQLERIFRKKSVESFKNLAADYPDLLLFLNVEVTILPEVIGSDEISKLFKKYNMDPRRVVLEINEEKCDDFLALKKFVDIYRQQGFLIALDDVGKAFSNFNRISSLKPKIIKIDRNIITGIDKDYYKQEILLALCRLARKTGIKIIAEGVETKAELEFLIKSEVDIIQGYIFSAPNPAIHWSKKNNHKNIKRLTPFIEKSMQGKVNAYLYKNKIYQIIFKEIINEIKFIKTNKLNQYLIKITDKFIEIEAAYILNGEGIQISKTVISQDIDWKASYLYQPANQGTDHSYKKYYYYLKEIEKDLHITEPYISYATGNQCLTISSKFLDENYESNILCIDFKIN